MKVLVAALLSLFLLGAAPLLHTTAQKSGPPRAKPVAEKIPLSPTGSGGGGESAAFARYFAEDPLGSPDAKVSGEALARLTWEADTPAYPGDAPGSLRALYDSSQPAGWYGFELPAVWKEDDTFSAAAAFVIDSEGFSADPNGFFQISWGLWNSATTGLNRTGNATSFAADTYELVGLDYFPNVSPFFGGPFVAPSLFGAEVPGDGFNNFTSLFGLEAALPLDVPLLAVLEHRPDLDALVMGVYRIVDSGHVLPLNGVVGVASLAGLPLRDYAFDTIGITLWNDGFTGPVPSVLATLHYHALTATKGLPDRPESMLAIDESPGGDDDEEDDESGDDDEDGD